MKALLKSLRAWWRRVRWSYQWAWWDRRARIAEALLPFGLEQAADAFATPEVAA